MPLAKFDPWKCLRDPVTNAYPAYPAYSATQIGGLGGLGIGASDRINEFEERSAILETTCGHARDDAESIAASSLGYACPADLRAAAIDHWRKQLTLISRADQSDLHNAALTLPNGPWIAPLVALGWDEISLFGCETAGYCAVGLVTAVRTQPIIAVTANSVRYSDASDRPKHHYRFASHAQTFVSIKGKSNVGEHAWTAP